MDKVYYTWQQVHDLIHAIVGKIQQDDWKPQMVVGITRGGLVPAVMISHEFETPLETINLSLRDNPELNDQNLQKISDYTARGWKVLVVDDINDTGATIAAIRNQVILLHRVKIAVLSDNVTSMSKVDYWGTQINKQTDPSWIVFPWEKDSQS